MKIDNSHNGLKYQIYSMKQTLYKIQTIATMTNKIEHFYQCHNDVCKSTKLYNSEVQSLYLVKHF